MSRFQAILGRVLMLLSGPGAQARALLDHLLEERLLSEEYHRALLQESDGEALARKIALTLLDRADPDLVLLGWVWSELQAPLDPGGAGSGQCAAMEAAALEGSYLSLLSSSTDLGQLTHLWDPMELAEEDNEDELCSEPDLDTINCEQLSKLLWEMEDEEETREAYASIAELDRYVFQECPLEGPSRDSITLEEIISETTEAPEAPAQRRQKRAFSEELPEDPKHRKLAKPPAAATVTGSFLLGPATDSWAQPCLSPPGLLSPEPPSQIPLEGAIPAPIPGPLLGCLSLPAGAVQVLGALPVGLWHMPTVPAAPGVVLCQNQTPPASHTPPPGSHGLPMSPERPGSTSPFAPSAADLPGLPEPALTSRAHATEAEAAPPTQDPEASDGANKLPESVERFRQALRDRYGGEPAGEEQEALSLEVPLLRARLERVSSKSQERELVPQAWTERTTAPGDLAELLAAPRPPRVVAVLGGPGQGKSHCVRGLSRAWALGRLPCFDFVFRLPCRELDLPGGPRSLRALLDRACPRPLDDATFRWVSRRPHRVLLLLDGLEELEGAEGPTHAPGPVPPEHRAPPGPLAGLLQRRLLPGCSMLLTARPRARLPPGLGKADAVWELPGFSAADAEVFVRRTFQRVDDPEEGERAWARLRARPFLLAHCHCPSVCRALCRFLREPAVELPDTLTGLYVGLLGLAARDAPPGAPTSLARLAWELGLRHHSELREDQVSAELRTWALAAGWLRLSSTGLAFAGCLLQCFLAAAWLALSPDVKDKALPQYLALTPRKKRPYDNWLEATPRFLAGLVFQPPVRGLGALVGPVPAALRTRKQKALARYLRRLQPGSLRPSRLVELLHCVHEAGDAGLWQHVARGLPERLSFLGARLRPADVHLLGRALEAAGRRFSLDLRSTGVEPAGLGGLVGLPCVTRFRAAVRDVVGLWEALQQRGDAGLLRAAEDKFTIEPFQVQAPKDVEDLASLVSIQRARRAAGDSAAELPAVRDLKKLEFALGPVLGPQAFPALAGLLETFSSLQHLDLDALSENKIGDEGVALLAATFPQLKALQTLNLSQNSISDAGACKLAAALPSLAASLIRLSLYNNYICDEGAGSLAKALPDMAALRVLDVQYNKFTAAGAQQLTAGLKQSPHLEKLAMWTPTIPFGVQEHLQQLDPRISLR